MLLVSGNDEDEVSERAEELITAGEWKVWNDLRFDRYSGNHYIELMQDDK